MNESFDYQQTMTTEPPSFNNDADKIYGSILILIFMVGTLGNIISFTYFRSKKRDVANTAYMLITVNDVVVSVTALPVGLSFLTNREPGVLFGNNISRTVWFILWEVSVRVSIFLVMCLCVCRTYAFLRPFQIQKIRPMTLSIVLYVLFLMTKLVIVAVTVESVAILYFRWFARPILFVENPDEMKGPSIFFYYITTNINQVIPVFVVGTSCLISVLLLRRNQADHRCEHHVERTRVKKRAVWTILLFALLYVLCNGPFIFENIISTHVYLTNNRDLYLSLYNFDSHCYFANVAFTLLVAGNSAANPILYVWRMPRLRAHVLSAFRPRMPRQNVRNSYDHATGNGVMAMRRSFTSQTVAALAGVVIETRL